MDQQVKIKKKRPTQAEILASLEENGLSLTKEGLGPWSHSKVKTLRNCPLKFYLSYVIKEKAEAPPISIITEVGKATHRILELLLGGKTIEQAYKIAREEFVVIPEDEWEAQVKSVEFNILKFKERIDACETSTGGIKRIFQEIRIGCTRDWQPTGFFSDDVYYRGVIDLVLQLNNGDILIVDHKYGTSAQMGLRNFKEQLNTYQVLFHKGVESITGAQSGIHHIKEGEVVLDDYHEVEEIETNLLNNIEFNIQGAIDGLLEKGYFKHIAGGACMYCEFAPVCKAGGYKELEQGTKRWFKIKKME